jgi:hypothetical protein
LQRVWSFRRKRGAGREGATALAERPAAIEDFHGSDEELLAEIERLTAENRANRSHDAERRLLRLRHLAGLRRLQAQAGNPEHPAPDFAALPHAETLPDIASEQITPALLRAGILRDGCLLVRGLIDREQAVRFAEQIDLAFDERVRREAGEQFAEGYCDVFAGDPRYDASLDDARPWVKEGGGLLAADAPGLSFEMNEMFRTAGLPELVRGYLGEPPLISVHKTTLRKADPSVGGGWHQDGAFMGDVRSLNLWLSLSRCGDESPGLDVVPRRLDHLVTSGTDETFLEYQVSQRVAEESAGDKRIIRPIFEPGDALFFDELFLHKTGSDPSMPKARFAIENWFFGGSAFPAEYAPIAV